MVGWRSWTVDKFRRQPFVAWPLLVVTALIGFGALLNAVGVIGDWGRWATGHETPAIVEFQRNDLWDDPSYYVVIENRGSTQVRLFAVEYQSSAVGKPLRGHPEPTAALLAEHDYKIPLSCGESRKVQMGPNFVVEAKKSEGLRLTLLAPEALRGSECKIALRFDSSAGPTNWYQFKAFFPHRHKPCKVVHIPSGGVKMSDLRSALKDSECVQWMP